MAGFQDPEGEGDAKNYQKIVENPHKDSNKLKFSQYNPASAMEPDTLCITKNMLEAALKQWETDAKATPNHSQEGQVILDLEDLGETLLEEVWLTLCNIRNINDETSNRNHT